MRKSQLELDIPQAKAVLLRKMDLAENQLSGLDGRLEYNNRQAPIYQERYDTIMKQMSVGDELDKLHLENQALPYKQKLDEFAADNAGIREKQIDLANKLQEHSANLQKLNKADLSLQSNADLSPWKIAEDTIAKLRKQDAITNNEVPLRANATGLVTERTTLPREVQSTAEKYSTLKALKDCIGRAG